MNFFELILVSGVIITGMLGGIAYWLKPKPAPTLPLKVSKKEEAEGWGEQCRSIFKLLLLVLLVRTFVYEPFRIPSISMMPTLLVGDFILVNKWAYGLRLPLTNTKIVNIGEPKRGDVVVFRHPIQQNENWIKRIIGLPGDRVEYKNHRLTLNGKLISSRELNSFSGVGQGAEMTGASLKTETLTPQEHAVLEVDDPVSALKDGVWVVPKGQYFVMGDNRDRSADSRYWGFLPEKDLRGSASIIWMNFDGSASGVDWSRLGTQIK